jgi:protein SCO1/2
MSNTHIIPTHKIVVFIVFVCAAIMASLFVYRSSQKPATPVIAPEVGTLFSVPRDIKSFKLTTAHDQDFTEKDFYQHWTLVFFGFTHCSKVCPTNLDLLNKVYEPLHTQYPNLRVVLISVDPERDTTDSLTQYVHSFNPAFQGVTGKIQDIRKLQSQLGIYAARDEATPVNNYQIQHTSSILLINPQGKWAGLFQFGLKPTELIQAVKAGIG